MNKRRFKTFKGQSTFFLLFWFKFWKLEIPKPFTRCGHYAGEPFYLSKNVSIEEATEIVKKNINDAGRKAFEIYNKKYNRSGKKIEYIEEDSEKLIS